MDGDDNNYVSNSIATGVKESTHPTTSVVIHNRDNQKNTINNHSNHHHLNNGEGSRSHKNSSSSFGKSSTASHRQQQHFHTAATHQTTVIASNSKMKNNIGHKVSQTKRIQLSTAAKRCKSMEKSNAGDNNDNNSKVINHVDDICKADDDYVDNTNEDENHSSPVVNARSRPIKDDLSANNSTQTQSTESPTLVRVKMWQTESCVLLPHQHMA